MWVRIDINDKLQWILSTSRRVRIDINDKLQWILSTSRSLLYKNTLDSHPNIKMYNDDLYVMSTEREAISVAVTGLQICETNAVPYYMNDEISLKMPDWGFD